MYYESSVNGIGEGNSTKEYYLGDQTNAVQVLAKPKKNHDKNESGHNPARTLTKYIRPSPSS
jgi:hypothetical protein